MKNRKTFWGYFLTAIFAVNCQLTTVKCFAQTTATLKGDSSKIQIGDLLNLKLVINTTPNTKINFPKFSGDTLGKVEIVSKNKIDTATMGNRVIYSQTLSVSAYDSGEYYIAPVKIDITNAANQQDSAFTNDLLISVSTLNVDTSKPFAPIKAPLKVAYQVREFLWWIVALVALILIAIVAYFLYKKYKNKAPVVEQRPKPKDPPHIWARKELQKLEQAKLWQRNDHKQYYSRLTDILRGYLEYRYDYYALEATTEEINKDIDNYGVSLDAKSKLMEVLRLADFVKFAKLNPAPDQNTMSLENAKQFIDVTVPISDTEEQKVKKD
jgi:hypothetical protein